MDSKKDVPAGPNTNGARPSFVELRNGKLNLKQRVLVFEKMSETMQEIVKFREVIEQRIEGGSPPLDAVPQEFMPLIAKLVHESDKTSSALAKYMHGVLIIPQDEDKEEAIQAASASLPLDVLDKAVKLVASRINYGLEVSTQGTKVPAAWSIWRWEVKDELRGWLPKAVKEKVEARLAERIQAKKDVQDLFASLPITERSAILGVKFLPPNEGKIGLKSEDDPKFLGVIPQPVPPSDSSNTVDESLSGVAQAEQSVLEGQVHNGPGRSKKVSDLEKTAKVKEKEEKKNARLEKEKKDKAAQEKSRTLMASFFTKNLKTKPPTEVQTSAETQGPTESVAGPSQIRSDYARTFKPFALKKDVELAPINGFRQSSSRNQVQESILPDGKAVIVIDDDEPSETAGSSSLGPLVIPDLGQSTIEERLVASLALISRPRAHRAPAPSDLKLCHPYVVRNIVSQLNEAEIAGDVHRVRSLLSLLRNRRAIPVKVLIFAEDARPGYFGTWTRNSRSIGPRTPLARDVVALDYTYDSGEEWEEENGEADDVVEGADDDDPADDRDSDLDGWLVDDDEVEEPGTPVEERELSPGMPPPDLPAPVVPKRKQPDDSKKAKKRRKVVVHLVPFTRGPCWEVSLGNPAYEPFKPYRIQLLNDTPFPINPFTFTAPAQPLPQEHNEPLPTSSGVQFAVPALPDRLQSFAHGKPITSNAPPTQKRSVAATPKTPFPDTHIPLLVAKVSAMQTGNITGIVETVYQELRSHKVKKNAIEAKLREIGEKSKERKIWVVKPEFMST